MALASSGTRTLATPRGSPARLGSSLRLGSSSALGTPRRIGSPTGGFLYGRTVTGQPDAEVDLVGRTKSLAAPDPPPDTGRKQFGYGVEQLEGSPACYEGEFKIYQRSGEGVMKNSETGATYTGQFQEDTFHGMGDNTWPDGSRYVGQYRMGEKHGQGRFTTQDGLSYDGHWDKNQKHGRGVQEYANGDRYDGDWYHGFCSGAGTFYFADGSRYEGAWANGRYDGSGVFVGAEGDRERRWYRSGLLMRREVVAPSSARTPTRSFNGKVLFAQTRGEMHRPSLMAKLQPSKHLIYRQTAGRDLSAPPLRRPGQAAELMDGYSHVDNENHF